ncbi:hypothetical protein GCM10009624_13900 [Gordonia sinesedis]
MSGLPTGVGTGVGSMPGTDPREAAGIVVGEVDFGYVPELPDRGIGADMVGAMAAILVDLPIDAGPHGYRLSARPSSVTRRATDFWRIDLDAVEELWDAAGFVGTGRPFKVQCCGPFTFAASVELPSGHKALRDRGAVRDIVESTAEGLRAAVGEVTRRLGADVVVQLDEPLIDAVLDGTVTPLTRMDPIPAIPLSEVADALDSVVRHVGRPAILHNCGTTRWDLAERLPGVAQSVELLPGRTVDTATLDGIGALIERGDVLVAGVVAAVADPSVSAPERPETIAQSLAGIVDRIGLPRNVLSDNVIVTPTCGLAGATPAWARTALGLCAKVGDLLATDPAAL